MLVGLGAAPEAIETDPMMYDLLYERAWSSAEAHFAHGAAPTTRGCAETETLPDERAWVRAWATRRYASYGSMHLPAAALEAWQLLLKGPYGCTRAQQGPVGSLVAARPRVSIPRVSCCDESNLYYDPKLVVQAWQQLLSVGSTAPLAQHSAFLHDVCDVGVQALSNAFLAHHTALTAAATAQPPNRTEVAAQATWLLRIINATEELAARMPGRLLGEWIAAARESAEGDAAAADLFERNARTIVTLWGKQTSGLHEYSYRRAQMGLSRARQLGTHALPIASCAGCGVASSPPFTIRAGPRGCVRSTRLLTRAHSSTRRRLTRRSRRSRRIGPTQLMASRPSRQQTCSPPRRRCLASCLRRACWSVLRSACFVVVVGVRAPGKLSREE
jgi:hypothetical protein